MPNYSRTPCPAVDQYRLAKKPRPRAPKVYHPTYAVGGDQQIRAETRARVIALLAEVIRRPR